MQVEVGRHPACYEFLEAILTTVVTLNANRGGAPSYLPLPDQYYVFVVEVTNAALIWSNFGLFLPIKRTVGKAKG